MIKFVNKPTGSRVPTAIVREDGSFQVSYFDQEDGAPVGEYQLLVVWMVPPPEGGLPRDRLQGKYLDPRRPVRTVTVAAGGVALDPIELTTTGASP